jgi:hypothetical protein
LIAGFSIFLMGRSPYGVCRCDRGGSRHFFSIR